LLRPISAKKKRSNGKKKPNKKTRSEERRISKAKKKKPLNPNDMNNSPQAYKIVKKCPKENKWAQVSPKKEVVSLWEL